MLSGAVGSWSNGGGFKHIEECFKIPKVSQQYLLWMEEILHHLGWWKTYK
jgi:hypothetical protein